MIYVQWFVLFCISLIVDLLGLLVVAAAVLLVGKHEPLPWWAWPWNNDREPFGDAVRKAEMDAASLVGYKFLLWLWLVWRNPGNNFGYLLGFEQAADTVYVYDGDPDTGDQSRPGTLFVRAIQTVVICSDWSVERTTAFCLYHVSRPYWLFGRRCLRVFLGWKIHDMVKDGTRAQIVGVINPFMSYEGI